MDFGKKNFFLEIDLFDFTSFFGLDFLKFSGPLCNVSNYMIIWDPPGIGYPHSGPENLKKSRPKKLVKSNKSISRKFFDQIPFFAISNMAKNQFLNWENV